MIKVSFGFEFKVGDEVIVLNAEKSSLLKRGIVYTVATVDTKNKELTLKDVYSSCGGYNWRRFILYTEHFEKLIKQQIVAWYNIYRNDPNLTKEQLINNTAVSVEKALRLQDVPLKYRFMSDILQRIENLYFPKPVQFRCEIK